MIKLGEALFEEGLIAREQLDEALKAQKNDRRKLGELLVERGWIEDQKLSEVLARLFQIPFVRLSEGKINEKILSTIPQELIQRHKIIPLDIKDNCLTVATSNPLDMTALQEIQLKCGYLVNPVMAGRLDIERHLQNFSASFHTLDAMRALEKKDMEGSHVGQLVESIFRHAIGERASDIHFEPQAEKMRVRFRIDGVLYEKSPIPKGLSRNVISRIKIISGMDVADNRRPQDGRASFKAGQDEYDLRISSIPDMFGENLVLRILNKQFVSRSFESLGMEPEQVKVLTKLMERPYGLILVTGPTGAGKTTTLYSALNLLNSVSKNIISVEDPVEYQLSGITQTAVSPFTGYTFATAIRYILRHDPDVIMVGEIRDVETADMAIRAALTGHLVFSTMHTNSAAGAITRLLEMDIEPFLISSAVQGVLAQRLVRRLCPHCRKEYRPTEDVVESLKSFVPAAGGLTLAAAVGCEACLQTGFQGRAGVFEMLEVDERIRAMMLKSAGEKEIAQAAIEKGMKNLRMAGLARAVSKLTTLEEALRIAFVE